MLVRSFWYCLRPPLPMSSYFELTSSQSHWPIPSKRVTSYLISLFSCQVLLLFYYVLLCMTVLLINVVTKLLNPLTSFMILIDILFVTFLLLIFTVLLSFVVTKLFNPFYVTSFMDDPWWLTAHRYRLIDVDHLQRWNEFFWNITFLKQKNFKKGALLRRERQQTVKSLIKNDTSK